MAAVDEVHGATGECIALRTRVTHNLRNKALFEPLIDCVPEGKCVRAASGISEDIQALRFRCLL